MQIQKPSGQTLYSNTKDLNSAVRLVTLAGIGVHTLTSRIAEKRRRDVETEEAQEEEEQAARGTIELGSKEKFEGCVYGDLNGNHRRFADSAGPGTRGQRGRRACDPFAPAAQQRAVGAQQRVAGARDARPVMRDERTIAYIQPTSSPPYYDDLTGDKLDTAKAEEAMQKERNSLNEFKTYEVIDSSTACGGGLGERGGCDRPK
jgi:hypothetical protein